MEIFMQLSLLLLVVFLVSFIMRMLKQPLIIGYIISGILIGPLFLKMLPNEETLSIFSQFGIAFLLFIVGLNLSPSVIKEVGKISLITGIGQVLFTSIIGYFLGIMLNFSPIVSIYLAVALTFSSTIIIMKLLSDKDSLDKLYGKISIGFLLVQDIIAIFILIIVSSFSSGANPATIFTSLIIKGIGVIFALLFLNYYVVPKINAFFAKSHEFLFLFSIAWGLGISSLFYLAGLSVEVGALVAGILLSVSPYSYDISSRLRPLRDFFLISFFILLGSQMVFGDVRQFIIPALIFSAFILIGNPLIVMTLMGFFGHCRNTGFMAGLTVAQISEFSLILIAMGVRVGHLSREMLSFVTIIGLITIAGSTYMIIYSEKIYSLIYKYLSVFERKHAKEHEIIAKNYEYILFGSNRIGFSIINAFNKIKANYVVVDYNPDRVSFLCSKGIKCIYGDVSNAEFLDDLRMGNAKIIVSTIPELDTNLMLIRNIRSRNKKVVVIATSRQISETKELYKAGANYVILPHVLGGEYTARVIEKAKTNKRIYEQEMKKLIKELKPRFDEESLMRHEV